MAGFRTIVINKRCKLESLLGSLVIRTETEERIHINEIETLIVESTAVAITSALVADLTEAGANIIFCDRKHLPVSVFVPVHAHYATARNIKIQIAWCDKLKLECWGQIIKEKIRQQSLHLSELGKSDEQPKGGGTLCNNLNIRGTLL
jgi:CRISPR/Cas system-associated endonuclease Cas1